jgi:hypothetical protein
VPARDQVCRMAVEPLEVCLVEKLVDGECHVWRSVVMVKNLPVLLPKFQLCLSDFLVNTIKQMFDFLFDLVTFLDNFQHALSLNQILLFTHQPNTLRLKRKQQKNRDRE